MPACRFTTGQPADSSTRAGDDPGPVDHHQDRPKGGEQGDRSLIVDRRHSVLGRPVGVVHRGCGQDGGPATRPPASENGLEQGDEEDLADGGWPPHPSGPATGHAQARRRVLDDHDQVGHPGCEVVGDDVGAIARSGQEHYPPVLGGRQRAACLGLRHGSSPPTARGGLGRRFELQTSGKGLGRPSTGSREQSLPNVAGLTRAAVPAHRVAAGLEARKRMGGAVHHQHHPDTEHDPGQRISRIVPP